jgi:putative salt-induced outer membrane protein YdiY
MRASSAGLSGVDFFMRWQNLWLLLCCVCLPSWADTVWLNNGDRLTGTIVLLEGGKLVLKTKYAGRVMINWSDISTLRSDQPLLVKQSGFEREQSKSLEAAGQGMVRLENHENKTLPLADITQMVPPRPFIEDLVWEGNLEGKLNIERDNEEVDDWRLKLDTTLRHGRWRHKFDGSQRHETKNGKKIKDEWEANSDQDYFLTDQWFLRGSLGTDRNQFDTVERQDSVGFGPGYSFWNNALGHFELIGQLQHYELYVEDEIYRFDATGMNWDFKRLLWGTRFELYSTGDFAAPHVGAIDYVLDSEIGLRYRINEWARVSLLYELSQVRGAGQTASGREYTLGVGVGW